VNRKVLFVNTKSSVWGGVERYIETIVPVLKKQGYSISGLFEEKPDYDDGFISNFERSFFYDENIESTLKMLREDGVSVVFVHKIASEDLLKRLQSMFKTVFFIHDHDYYCFRRHKYFPVVRKNCICPNNFIYCSMCSGMVNKVFGKIRPINIFQKQKMFNLVKKADHFIVLSDHMKNNLTINKFQESKITKIYPIKTVSETKNENNQQSLNILYAGQIIRGKGFDLLLEAVSKIHMPFHLDVIGKGDDEKNINNLVEKYGLKDKITFHGWVNNAADYFRNASVVVFPSRWQEPFGLVGIEAFSHKRPVVAFNVGGVSEWLKDGANGYLIEPFDTSEMAEKIEELLKSPEKAQKMGEAGAALLIKEFSPEKFAKEFESVMDNLDV
jgi:glycosyltransferase involved in cell wall biosynthesis